MKKILSLLLALSMALSLFTVAASAADTSPAIVNVVAINDHRFQVTTSKAVKLSGSGWGLFVSADGINVASLSNPDRYALHPLVDYVNSNYYDKFIVEVDVDTKGDYLYNASEVIKNAQAAGKKVFLGLNGGKGANGIGLTDATPRAVDVDGYGFTSNLTNSTHGIHAVPVEAFAPLSIQSVKVCNATQLEIEFSNPIASFSNATVLFGVLNAEKTDMYFSESDESNLDTTTAMVGNVEDGKLICHFETDKTGMTENARNLYKIVAAIKSAYPALSAGIKIVEGNVDTNVKNNKHIDSIYDENGLMLKENGALGDGRSFAVASVTPGVLTVGDEIYYSFDEAMANATSGDTIILNDDVTVTDDYFMLSAGITLDLNGHDLTVENYLLPLGTVIDSDAENKGKLIVDADKVVGEDLDSESYMPLYNETAGGYQFYKYTFRHVENVTESADTVQYSVGLKFDNDDAYALLADKDLGVRMTIDRPNADLVQSVTWIFSDTLMETFIAKNTDADGLYAAVTVTVSGVEAIGEENISAEAVLASIDGTLNLTYAMDPIA